MILKGINKKMEMLVLVLIFFILMLPLIMNNCFVSNLRVNSSKNDYRILYLSRSELNNYFKTLKMIGESSFQNTLLPLLDKYNCTYEDFYFEAIRDDFKVNSWVENIKYKTDRETLLRFKQDIYKCVREEK